MKYFLVEANIDDLNYTVKGGMIDKLRRWIDMKPCKTNVMNTMLDIEITEDRTVRIFDNAIGNTKNMSIVL